MSEISRKEVFGHDVCLEWLDNDQIVIFSATRPSRDTVDTWAEKVIEITDQYRYKVRYIHDFSQSQVVLTPYAREKAKLVNDTHPDAKGYVAVILQRSILSQALRLFLNHDLLKRQPNITNRVFFNREDALDWLRQFPVEESDISPE